MIYSTRETVSSTLYLQKMLQEITNKLEKAF